jgi:hypothetical protein
MRSNPPARRALHAGAALALTLGLVTALVACSSSNAAVPTLPGGSASSTAAGTTTPGNTSPASSVSSTSAAPTSTTVPPTTTAALVTTGGVVKVANASGMNGAAGQMTAQLAAKGFATRKATNAFGPDEKLKVSKIYVVKGSEPVAQSVSQLLGGLEVFPMTTPAWIIDGTVGLADATVLVMLGQDLAGKKLAQISG